MRIFKMNKLVRDKVVDNILKRKAEVKTRNLDDNEFIDELKKKLQEELLELVEVDSSDRAELINELADMQLLVDYFSKTVGVSKADLDNKNIEKSEKAGNFDKRIFIESVTLQDDDLEWIEYYQKKGFEEIK